MFIGSLINAVVLCLFLAAVYKIFQLSSELSEVKEMVREIKRNMAPENEKMREAEQAAYTPPDLSALAAEIELEERAREERPYEVPDDKITVLDPPRN